MSIEATVPGGWLVFANGVYRYQTSPIVFGIGVLSDQQAAGAIMQRSWRSSVGVIVVIYGRHAKEMQDTDLAARRVRDRNCLCHPDLQRHHRRLRRITAIVER
ncbi:MAG: hypothetical protein R2706_18765 [Acidimicrobiales bacterium]